MREHMGFRDNVEHDRQDAELGSAALKKALYRATHGFAVRHGISVVDARFLLLNTGVRVPA